MDLVKVANEFKVICKEDADKCAELLKGLKALEAEIRASFDPIIDKAYKAHREAIAQRDEHLKPVLDAMKKIKSSLADWQTEEERKAKIKALEEIEKKKKEEEEKQLSLAEMLSKMGATEQAEEVLDQEVIVAPEKIETPKIAGVSFLEVWDFEIVDEKQLPREYLTPDLIKIRQVVKATKGTLEIAGVKIFSRKVAR